MELSTQILLPAAVSGIVASFILAISRAIGETMIVTLAAGATPKLTANPLESVQTMTSYIVQASLGDTAQGTIEFRSLFAVGLLLFLLTRSEERRVGKEARSCRGSDERAGKDST